MVKPVDLKLEPKLLHYVVCVFELLLNIPFNSYGHIVTLLPFYGTFTQNKDVVLSKKCFMYIYMDGLT